LGKLDSQKPPRTLIDPDLESPPHLTAATRHDTERFTGQYFAIVQPGGKKIKINNKIKN